MQYEAPKFDESKNPNVSHDAYQLRELRSLLGYVAVLFVIVWLVVELLVWTLPHTISLEREKQWFQFVGTHLIADEDTQPDAELQKLAKQLATHMNLPPNAVQVYISEDDVLNAYATFGGNVVLYRGLLNRLPDEASVAAVLAHEMAHIKHRDPLRGMSRGVFYSAIGAALGSDSQMQKLARLEGLRYSRELEEAADAAAVDALVKHYHHAQGMIDLLRIFQKIEQEQGAEQGLIWLKTHPDTAQRLHNIQQQIQPIPQIQPNPTPLPNRWQKHNQQP